MFWGLIIDSNRRYSQTIENSFHISMASLDVNKASDDNVQVSVSYEGTSYLLCTLNKNSVMQQPLDLEFKAGTKISFSCIGNGRVHLTGFFNEEEDDMFDGLDENDSLEESDEEVPELMPIEKKRKAKAEKNDKQNKNKKAKLDKGQSLDMDDSDSNDEDYNEQSGMNQKEDSDNDDDGGDDEEDDEEDGDEGEGEGEGEDDDDEDDEDDEEQEEEKEKVTKKPAKNDVVANGKDTKPAKENKSQKKNKDKKDNSKTEDKPEQQQEKQQKKRVIEGGVQIEDIRVGNGQPAKAGKFVCVYYVGRLKNGKKFDQTISGEGFKFRLGKSEVIKGWDVGIAGMKVGGKRKIIVPPNMAYGSKGSPPVIPPNSQLIFEVELKSVN